MDLRIKEILKAKFPILSEEALKEEIAKVASLKKVEANTLLMDIGMYVKFMPLLIKGSIKVVREDENSNEILLYYLNAGNTCAMSLTCCIQQNKSKIRAITEEACEIINIPVDYTDKWLLSYPSWKNFIMETYQQRFEDLLSTIDSIAFLNMDERLLNYLNKKIKNNTNEIQITHQEIAYDLNSSREVISRLLKKMEQKNMVILNRNKIKLIHAM